MYKIMGTGSRKLVLREDRREIYGVLEYYLKLKLEAHPDLVLISGMAEGWDECLAWIGLRNQIPYHVYIPTASYGSYYWGRNSLLGLNRMDTFNKLVEGAQEVHYICNSLYVDGVHANFVRNDAMVEAADYAVVYDARSRGTSHAVAGLRKNKVPYSEYPFTQGELL